MEILFKKSCLYLAMIFVVFCSVPSIEAQNISNPIHPKVGLPPALGKTQPLSPQNLSDYQLMVMEYADAACLPVSGGRGTGAGSISKQVGDLQDLLKKRDATLKATLKEKEDRAAGLQTNIDQLDYQLRAHMQLDGMKNQLRVAESEVNALKAISNENYGKLRAEEKKRQIPAVRTLVEALRRLQQSYDRDLLKTEDHAEWLRGHITGLETAIKIQDKVQLQDTLTGERARLDEVKLLITSLKAEATENADAMRAATSNKTCDDERATRLRDNLIYIAISQSDIVFTNYRLKRRSWTDYFDLLMNFLEIGFTTSAVITNGARPKSVLSSLSGLVKETHSTAQRDLKLKENQIYFNTMEAKRSKIFKVILDQMTETDAKYSYPMALMDIMKYVKAGTLDDAMSELVTTTGADRRDAEITVKFARTIPGKVATPEVRNTTVNANNIVNNLATKVSTGSDTEKTSALASLQKIVDGIQKDAELTTAINGNTELKTLMDKVVEQKNNGLSLAQAISDLKAAIYGVLAEGLVMKLNQIIIDNGSDTKK
jgi:hypothetical protein